MKHIGLPIVVAGLGGFVLLFGPTTAAAQHAHTIGVTSDAADGGQMLLAWDFEGQPIARVADSGLAGVFTGNIPGLNDGTGDGLSTFTLATSPTATQVDIELMAIDEGMRWIFTNGPLEVPGDLALLGTMPSLHNHADFELTTDGDAKTFAEGRVSFRVRENPNTTVGYTPSDVRTLRVSNGYLPPLAALLTEDENKAQLKCQKAVAGVSRSFASKAQKLLAGCLDAVLAHSMLGKSADPALKKCDVSADPKSLVSKIAAEKEKAVAKIAKKCGVLSTSSLPYTESHIYTHLGMAACRAQELVGAEYNHAADLIGEVLEAASMGDHHDVLHALPCMVASFE